MQSDETKKKVINASIELFNQYGCKAITMDKISSSLHISKRTLYELFDNKEALLLECITEVHRTLGNERLEIIKKTQEPILMALFIIRNETSRSIRYSRILNDAEHFYPELTVRLLKKFSDRFKQILINILTEANDNGDLRPDINIRETVDIIALNISIGSVSFNKNNLASEENAHLIRESCFSFLRGLLSIKAIQRYEQNEMEFRKFVLSNNL